MASSSTGMKSAGVRQCVVYPPGPYPWSPRAIPISSLFRGGTRAFSLIQTCLVPAACCLPVSTKSVPMWVSKMGTLASSHSLIANNVSSSSFVIDALVPNFDDFAKRASSASFSWILAMRTVASVCFS